MSSVFCFSFSCFLYARLISLYKLYLNVTQRATSLTSSSCSGSLPYFHFLMFDVLLCILSLWRIYDDDDDNEYTAEYPWMRSWWVRCGRGCPFSAREVLGKGQCLFPNFFLHLLSKMACFGAVCMRWFCLWEVDSVWLRSQMSITRRLYISYLTLVVLDLQFWTHYAVVNWFKLPPDHYNIEKYESWYHQNELVAEHCVGETLNKAGNGPVNELHILLSVVW